MTGPAIDFQVVLSGLRELAQAFIVARDDVDARFPQLTSAREVVVHDEAFGDGGVRRVHHMASLPTTTACRITHW